jgi:ankyrin repeat protein
MKSLDSQFRDAAKRGDLDAMQKLKAAGARIDSCGRTGKSALWLACDRGHEHIIESLAAMRADMNAKGGDGESVLHRSIRLRQEGVVCALFYHGARLRTSPAGDESSAAAGLEPDAYAWAAPIRKYVEEARLEEAGEWAKRRFWERTWQALHREDREGVREALEGWRSCSPAEPAGTAELESKLLAEAARLGKTEMLGMLVERGAVIDGGGYAGDGGFPLGNAAAGGHVETIDRLLALGADIEMRQGSIREGLRREGHTALMLAAYKGRFEAIERLLDAGADVNARDWNGGRTALHHARTTDALQALIQGGADVNIRHWHGGQTPLHIFVNASAVKALIEAGADIEAVDYKTGNTPLMATLEALESGNSFPDEAGKAELLYRHGASIDSANGAGQTVRMWLANNVASELAALIRRIDGERALERDVPAGLPQKRRVI